MTAILVAFLIGVVAGLRTMTAPAAASWAAAQGFLPLGDTWLAFLGYRWTPWIFSVLAVVEFVTDQLPSTPSRTVPPQFGARIVMGALSGAAFGSKGGEMLFGALAGGVGAVVGTLGGAAVRARLAAMFGKDAPAAFIEDAVAVFAAIALVFAVR